MIGTTLAGRYEIIARVGEGGMALVYKALDVLLNRYVAVKVLRQQFVHDEEFVRRFRREAQSAASLSHPNVVSIYDVGQEDEVHYIVMECIDGQNLNEIIKERAPLQPEEAIRIATQICDALDHAHHNHIIHRDIKPHNILIGQNGRVKVTDFGIARAVTSSTITQTGSVVGSVHYFSPEHAKGISTGEKSDLYSLGIVLYQMLTGQLPFLGESPISVALKHLQEPFEEPRELNPSIPQSVENVILKSMRKNPDERYQSAVEMMRDLETVLRPERLRESKVRFVSPSYHYEDHEETRVMPAIREQDLNPIDTNPGMGAGRYVEAKSMDYPSDSSLGGASSAAHSRHSLAPRGSVQEGTAAVQNVQSASTAPAQKKWVKPALWITLTLVFLAIMIGVVFYVKSLLAVEEIAVPELVNLTESEAKAELEKFKLVLEDPIIRKPQAGVPKGIVFEQSKAPGTKVKEGASIKISVSEGEPAKPLPSVVGIPYDDAVKMLLEMGFDSKRIQRNPVFSDDVPEDSVVSMTPGVGENVDPLKDTVKLDVSKGKETFKMPNLVGSTKEEAMAKIESLGLKLKQPDGIIDEKSYLPEGQVIKQMPYYPNELVSKGMEVSIYVSAGYPPEAVEYSLQIPVPPKEEGKLSTIEIKYIDARGENRKLEKRKISTTQVFSVDLVVDPNKDGVVSVERDGEYLGDYRVTYVDVKQGTVPIPQIQPSAPTEPTGGTESPPSGNEGESGGEGESTESDNENAQDGEHAGHGG
ncbi:Stk1 family PASTA domain-containing Ser/Thr kinase [Paenibacillus agilis]|uniref:Serine/threonine-protein kinase PrkC n=1 Tax=Paenibacillus agilis TaxID=3020863 RepID=A0A559J4D7_9BACL|nr:Stk1 family PASTA domain-containing Ser/Thr kinase [Paenibacillus agilis]TVX94754.1 Stk1 family PASTA domain-containing Ser/Thr kinase [Paenibacillus agilis]